MCLEGSGSWLPLPASSFHLNEPGDRLGIHSSLESCKEALAYHIHVQYLGSDSSTRGKRNGGTNSTDQPLDSYTFDVHFFAGCTHFLSLTGLCRFPQKARGALPEAPSPAILFLLTVTQGYNTASIFWHPRKSRCPLLSFPLRGWSPAASSGRSLRTWMD